MGYVFLDNVVLSSAQSSCSDLLLGNHLLRMVICPLHLPTFSSLLPCFQFGRTVLDPRGSNRQFRAEVEVA